MALFNAFKGVAEYFTPVLTASQFQEKGVLTPEEFVLAGDQLIHTCKTWEWQSGVKGTEKPYLPKDKQFLITRNVPSLKRPDTWALASADEKVVEEGDGEDGWLSTHQAGVDGGSAVSGAVLDMDDVKEAIAVAAKEPPAVPEEIPDIDDPVEAKGDGGQGAGEVGEIPDMDEFEDGSVMVGADDAALPPGGAQDPNMLRAVEPEDDLVHTRTYDLTICYDKYFRTPRVYLFGYNEHRQPLTPDQIMEDISADHKNKTVTMETHPHLNIPYISIHPCRHASVMKTIVDRMSQRAEDDARKAAAAEGKEAPAAGSLRLNVNQYMFLFLKFISSVIPTIEYDYTLDVS